MATSLGQPLHAHARRAIKRGGIDESKDKHSHGTSASPVTSQHVLESFNTFCSSRLDGRAINSDGARRGCPGGLEVCMATVNFSGRVVYPCKISFLIVVGVAGVRLAVCKMPELTRSNGALNRASACLHGRATHD